MNSDLNKFLTLIGGPAWRLTPIQEALLNNFRELPGRGLLFSIGYRQKPGRALEIARREDLAARVMDAASSKSDTGSGSDPE